MHSIRTKFTMLTTCVAIISLSVITIIGAITTKNLGQNDAYRSRTMSLL